MALRPLHDLIAAHVLAAERLHGDDTPVPVLARGKTATGRAWVYVRVAKAMDYMLRRWDLFARFLDDGRKLSPIYPAVLGGCIRLKGVGAPKVMLIIREENEAARRFYEGLGYGVEKRTVMSRWVVEPPTEGAE